MLISLVAAAATAPAWSQIPISTEQLAQIRKAAANATARQEDRAPTAPAQPAAPAQVVGELLATWSQPAPVDLAANGGAVDLYVGLAPSAPGRSAEGGPNGFWSYGQLIYWALDDGVMGPAAAAVGGGRVTEYEFTFGVHADFSGDRVQPLITVNFYNAPPDPVAGATNPVVEPPAPVSSIGWLSAPLVLPAVGNYAVRSGLIDLTAFDLDESFYVEIIPLEWDALVGLGVQDPDVHAIFTGPGTVSYGTNQDRMWSDIRRRAPGGSFVHGNRNQLYEHPAEMDVGGFSPLLNQTGIILRGIPCSAPNVLQLDIHQPNDLCVRPGEPVTVTLSQRCLPGLVRGYQAFLEFEPARLSFDSGDYVRPTPYDLPILDPIVAVGGTLDLAAGINDPAGQPPTSVSGDLAVLHFLAGATEGLTRVSFRSHAPPTRFSDLFGGAVLPHLIHSQWICVDGTPPAMACPPNQTFACLSAPLPPPATNYPGFVLQGGNASDAGCGGPAVTVTHLGDVDNGEDGCPGSPRIVERTYRATDCAGNQSHCTQLFTWLDDQPPVILGCPANQTVFSQAPDCGAAVNWTPPTATDNCGIVTVGSTHAPGSFFPPGTTTVTYTFTDGCGSTSTCSFDVTVQPLVEFRVSVQLQPAVAAATFTRCITFEFWDCPDSGPAHTLEAVLSFSGGLATDVVLPIPCGAYGCITARDRLHTLRRTAALTTASGQYVADFTGDTAGGGDWLIGGNLNDDFYIDILDFGVYVAAFATNYGTPNTNCLTPAPHADVNGNGIVSTTDFTFILVNFLASHEPNCCGAADSDDGDERGSGPVVRLHVSELAPRGLERLAVADLNGDGWLDEDDLAAFLQTGGLIPVPVKADAKR